MPEQLCGLDSAWTQKLNTEYLLAHAIDKALTRCHVVVFLQTFYPQTPPHQLPINM